jgi:hypothetical protein
MPRRKAKTEAAPAPDADAAEAALQAEDAAEPGSKPILPLFVGADGWYIDASELSPDCPEWGPYGTKAEANEDRRPSFRKRVRELRKRVLTTAPKPV